MYIDQLRYNFAYPIPIDYVDGFHVWIVYILRESKFSIDGTNNGIMPKNLFNILDILFLKIRMYP